LAAAMIFFSNEKTDSKTPLLLLFRSKKLKKEPTKNRHNGQGCEIPEEGEESEEGERPERAEKKLVRVLFLHERPKTEGCQVEPRLEGDRSRQKARRVVESHV
tara:strand:+ start:530 stop:838 length:309 start_codon:yes stop_codon:yes gene_type:complete